MTQSPTQRAYVQFNKGLLTERSEVSFPEGYSVDELNMDPQVDGSIKRRLGAALDTVENPAAQNSYITNHTVTTHTWTNVANDPSKTFTVVQNGLNLYVYDNNSTALGSATVSGDYYAYDTDGLSLEVGPLKRFTSITPTFVDLLPTESGSRWEDVLRRNLNTDRDPDTGDTLTHPGTLSFPSLASDTLFQSLTSQSWAIYDKYFNIVVDYNSIASIAATLDAAVPWGAFPTAAESDTTPVVIMCGGWIFFDFCNINADPTDGILIGWNYRTNDIDYYIHGANSSNYVKYVYPNGSGAHYWDSESGWRGTVTCSRTSSSFTVSAFTETYLNPRITTHISNFSSVRTAYVAGQTNTWVINDGEGVGAAQLHSISVDVTTGELTSYDTIYLASFYGLPFSIDYNFATMWVDEATNEVIVQYGDGAAAESFVSRFKLAGGSITEVWRLDTGTYTGSYFPTTQFLAGKIGPYDPKFIYIRNPNNNEYLVINTDTGGVIEHGTDVSQATYANYDDGFEALNSFDDNQGYDPRTQRIYCGVTYVAVNVTASVVPIPIDNDSYWENPHEFPLQSANSNGELIMASPGVRTFRLVYLPDDNAFEIRQIKFSYRDFGFADTRDRYLSERPTSDFTAAVCYDILNHGWHGKSGGMALERYIAARGLLPPLNLRWYASKDEYNKFDAAGFFDLAGGTSLVSSGHFILDLYTGDRGAKMRTSPFNPNWDYYEGNQSETTELNDYDYATQNPETNSTMLSLKSSTGSNNLKSISRSTGSITGDTSSRFYDFNTYVAATPTFTEYLERLLGKEKASWQIKEFAESAGTAQGQLFDYIRLYETRYYVTPVVGGGDLEPVLPTVDGELPEFTSAEFNADAIYAIDTAARLGVFVNNYTGTVTSIPETTRFRTVASFANRLFYAGLSSQRNTSNLYFSQILNENNKDAGRCYQEADPTSENFSDLLPTDGGIIKVNGAYNIKKLHPMRDRLLVIAENGVWAVRGVEGSFNATAFVIEKVSDVGLTYEQSFVSANGRPYWWSNQGIYTLQISPENGTLDVANMSEMTIQSFYDAISPGIKNFAKGFYDTSNRKVFWAYGDGSSIDGEYNNFLIFDEQQASFTPWTISDAEGTTPKVIGFTLRDGVTKSGSYVFVVNTTGDYVVDSNGDYVTVYREVNTLSEAELVLVCKDTSNKIAFATFSDGTYLDWGSATYSSYIETPYDFQGDLTIKKQAEYCTIYSVVTETGFELDENSNLAFANPSGGKFSCYWDFRTDASMTDQVFYRLKRYPVPEGAGDVTMPTTITSSRMRLKGRGRVVRLRFDAESGKQMWLVGYELMGLRNGRY